MNDPLTAKEAAKTLRVHPATVRKFINQKKLKAKKLAGKYGIYLIDRNDLLEFMLLKDRS